MELTEELNIENVNVKARNKSSKASFNKEEVFDESSIFNILVGFEPFRE